MEGHRGGQRAWWYRPDDINVASRTGYINIMLTSSFLRKTCPNGRNCCVRTRTGYGPCLPGLAFSRVNDLSGEGFSSSSLALEFWKGGDPLLSRESVSRDDLFEAARALLNSRFKLAAISSCVRHLDASMNQIRKVKRSNPSTG